ncbi:penicillin-binding protein activator [Qipengyuania sp.]|uniref:penicillin-binding protein activator n=1 Tax=Qipengyuania sp. TaxID=2004515 RepID=UPI0035C805B5
MAITRRALAVGGLSMFLGACAVIPKGAQTSGPVETTPTPTPSATGLPADQERHRVALLVPTTGTNGAVGQSIANASTMALLDTNASNLRITTYDTAGGARAAAQKAVSDGNEIILGPLMGDNVSQVLSVARPANLPVIAFSNDTEAASIDAFLMGQMPEQSIARSVEYARDKGSQSFAILAPEGEYGARAAAALRTAVATHGGRVSGSETYARGNTSVVSAARRLRGRGGYDSVLLADGPRLAEQGAAELRAPGIQLIGTELWSGDPSVARSNALSGAIFSAVSDSRYKRFSDSYSARFGGAPYRISTLGYDAVLLTLNIARDWKPGRPFPLDKLRDTGGFLGLDGAFRFGRDGIVERAMEVREVRNGSVTVVDQAPSRF